MRYGLGAILCVSHAVGRDKSQMSEAITSSFTNDCLSKSFENFAWLVLPSSLLPGLVKGVWCS